MKLIEKMRSVLLLGALLTFSTSFPLAQTADPAWLDTLKFEMERDFECEVAYYVRIKEGFLGTQKTYEARLQCIDGRQYDATRIGEDDDFDVKLCEIQTC